MDCKLFKAFKKHAIIIITTTITIFTTLFVVRPLGCSTALSAQKGYITPGE